MEHPSGRGRVWICSTRNGGRLHVVLATLHLNNNNNDNNNHNNDDNHNNAATTTTTTTTTTTHSNNNDDDNNSRCSTTNLPTKVFPSKNIMGLSFWVFPHSGELNPFKDFIGDLTGVCKPGGVHCVTIAPPFDDDSCFLMFV